MGVILLTPVQAEQVRGNHGTYSAIDPIQTEDGNFILPMDVLYDPEHAEVLDKLLQCQACDLTITEEVPMLNLGNMSMQTENIEIPVEEQVSDIPKSIYTVSNLRQLQF